MLIDGKMDEVSAMYESPITILRKRVVQSMNETLEEAVMKAVTELHVSVDKAELMKALTYDRNQYERGYADGKADTQPKWISVKERLPEHLVDVLVHVGEIVDIGFYDERCNAWECYSYRRGDVTHWMPLPEPPEEDDENENA